MKICFEVHALFSMRCKRTLVRAIWSEDLAIPVEHQRLVKNRMQRAKQNPDRLLDWDEASERLKP